MQLSADISFSLKKWWGHVNELIVQYLWFIGIYAFLGWCVEVAYHVVTEGKLVNRGFLNGPLCPIYGFGMSLLIYLLLPFMDNAFLLFLGSFILTSVLEYLTGFILEKIFNDKWWDYSQLPFNLKGYVALSFSIIWGLGGVFVLRLIHPPINRFVAVANNKIGNGLLLFILALATIDFIATISEIINIKKRILLIKGVEKELNDVSQHIGQFIYKGMTRIIQRKEILELKLEDLDLIKGDRESIELKLQKLRELNTKYRALIKDKSSIHKRLEKSFPNLRKRLAHLAYDEKDE